MEVSSSFPSRDESVGKTDVGGVNQGASVARSEPVNYSAAADPLNPKGFVIQSFSWQGQRTTYEGKAERPLLKAPFSEEEANNQPYEPAVCMAVNSYFCEELSSQLEKQKELKIEFSDLKKKLEEGKPLTDAEAAVVKQVTEKTAQKWSLPSTWIFGSVRKEDWIPTVSNPTLPESVDAERFSVIHSGLTDYVDSTEKAVKKVALKASLSEVELYKNLLMALSELKAILGQIQLPSAKQSEEVYKAKMENVKLALKAATDNMALNAQKAEEQGKGGFFDWIGPVIAAVAVVACIAAAVVTGGATIAVVALIVSSVMLAYTVADHFVGITAKIVQAIGELSPEFQALILVALIAVIIAMLCTSLGSGAVGVAQIALGATEQVVLQFAILTLLSSGIIANLAVEALVNSGALDPSDVEAIEKIKLCVMVISSAVLMVVTAAKMGGTTMKSLKDGARSLADSIKRTTVALGRYAKSLGPRIAALTAAQIKESILLLGVNIAMTASDVATQASASARAYAEDFKNALKIFLSRPENAQAFVAKVQTGLQLTNNATNLARGIIMADISKKLAEIEEKLGDSTKAQELYNLLVKIFEDMLAMLQGSQDFYSEWIRQVGQDIDAVSSSWTKAVHMDVRG